MKECDMCGKMKEDVVNYARGISVCGDCYNHNNFKRYLNFCLYMKEKMKPLPKNIPKEKINHDGKKC